MGGPIDDQGADGDHPPTEGADRAVLDPIFDAGRKARHEGIPRAENPYAAGSAEREEWDAGWCATLDIDADDGGDCGYQKN